MSSRSTAIRCMQMRGGTSKGAYFLGADLPADPAERDDLLLRIMGSPDERQIDGIGGGHPLTSKVAVVTPSPDDGADVDYLFLQVVPDRAIVTDAQTCGNLLAGVGPFAIERGLVPAAGETTDVRIRIMNPTVASPRPRCRRRRPGALRRRHDHGRHPVPRRADRHRVPRRRHGRSSPPAGSSTGSPASRSPASTPACRWSWCAPRDLGHRRHRAARGAGGGRRAAVHSGGDPAARPARRWDWATSPTRPSRRSRIVSPPRHGGTVTTRTFIPHRVHAAIGVLGAVSVAAGVRAPGTVADSSTVDAAWCASSTRRDLRRRPSSSTARARRPRAHAAPSCAPPASCSTASSGPAAERQPDERTADPVTHDPDRRRDIAHVGPVELYTPVLERVARLLRRPDGPARGAPRRRVGLPAHLGRLPVVDACG